MHPFFAGSALNETFASIYTSSTMCRLLIHKVHVHLRAHWSWPRVAVGAAAYAVSFFRLGCLKWAGGVDAGKDLRVDQDSYDWNFTPLPATQ